MFAKLKKKVEEELGGPLSAHLPSPGSTPSHTSYEDLRSPPIRPGPKIGRSPSIEEEKDAARVNSPTGSKYSSTESLNSSGMRKKSRDLHYGGLTTEELMNECKKLEQVLMKQQKLAKRKMQEKDEEVKHCIDAAEKQWKEKIEELDVTWQQKYKIVEQERDLIEDEKKNVVKRKLSLEKEVRKLEGFKNKLEEIPDEAANNNQELSRVRDCLILTESKVEQLQRELSVKEEALQASQMRVQTLQRHDGDGDSPTVTVQAEVHQVNQNSDSALRIQELEEQLLDFRKQLDMGQADILRLQEENTHLKSGDAANSIQVELRKKVHSLEVQLDSIESRWKEKMKQSDDEWGSSQYSLRDQLDKSQQLCKQLEYTNEILKEESTKSKTELSAKETRISELGSKIGKLENRWKESLSREEEKGRQVKALEAEVKIRIEEVTKEQKQLSKMKETNDQLLKEISALKVERDELEMRNAECSQQVQLLRQQERTKEEEMAELENKCQTLGETMKSKDEKVDVLKKKLEHINSSMDERIEASATVQGLRKDVASLSEQLAEKNQMIKMQEQRLKDMRKTLQREIRAQQTNSVTDGNGGAENRPSSPTPDKKMNGVSGGGEEEVNFVYLKHVLIKFLTSREYEALHLVKAISALLHLSPDEERLLKDTMQWKMSWFGSRPNLGKGQMAKCLFPS